MPCAYTLGLISNSVPLGVITLIRNGRKYAIIKQAAACIPTEPKKKSRASPAPKPININNHRGVSKGKSKTKSGKIYGLINELKLIWLKIKICAMSNNSSRKRLTGIWLSIFVCRESKRIYRERNGSKHILINKSMTLKTSKLQVKFRLF